MPTLTLISLHCEHLADLDGQDEVEIVAGWALTAQNPFVAHYFFRRGQTHDLNHRVSLGGHEQDTYRLHLLELDSSIGEAARRGLLQRDDPIDDALGGFALQPGARHLIAHADAQPDVRGGRYEQSLTTEDKLNLEAGTYTLIFHSGRGRYALSLALDTPFTLQAG